MLCAAGPAWADCSEANNGLTHVHYQTGATDIPRDVLPKLERFAANARYRRVVCIRGIVDAQGGDAPRNRQIARSRAFNIKLFLMSRGVKEDAIKVVTQNQGFTLWGALDPNQPAARRVRLTYN